MCMGTPMQVVEMRGAYALCEADGKQALVDMLLVGEQPPGTWILNFLGGAREVLTPEQAEKIRLALAAVSQVMDGQQPPELSHLFADLVDREPPLPTHLQQHIGQPPNKTGA